MSVFTQGQTAQVHEMYEMILNAKNTVIMTTYVFEPFCDSGLYIRQALRSCLAKRKQLLLNQSFWNASATTVDAHVIEADVRLWPNAFFDLLHAKFLVVDGFDIFITGSNIQDKNTTSKWQDTGIRFQSKEIALQLTEIFYLLYQKSRPCRSYHTIQQTQELPFIGSRVVSYSTQNMRLLYQSPAAILQHSRRTMYMEAIIDLIQRARKTICILSPNPVDKCILRVVLNKAESGVRVQIATNHRHNESYRYILGESETTAVCKWIHPNVELRYHNLSGCDVGKCADFIHHSKVIVVDDKFIYIGSANLDPISMHASGEIGITLECQDPEVIKILFKSPFLNARSDVSLCPLSTS